MRRLAVVIASLAALAVPSAAHAANRTDDFDKPVVFVPATEQASPSCSQFDEMAAHFAEYTASVGGVRVSLTGELIPVGLYAGSDGCSDTLGAGSNATIAQLGAKLAGWIKAKYKTQPIDIVAHGGGGLVVRSALGQDPSLHVEDVVTLGTPHNSDAGRALPKNPQGAGGTDWSVIGSTGDNAVSPDSSSAMDAEHKTLYTNGGPSHDGLLTDVSTARDAKIRYQHGAGRWIEWNRAPHSVERVAEELIFGAGSSEGVCGLQATEPGLCGRTPVILVPGFGASQIDCRTAFGTGNMWPQALFDSDRWKQLALGADGKSPLMTDNPCAKTSGPNGHLLYDIAGVENIHGKSWAWLQRIAPGRAYEFGWDFRKGPDQTLARLDKFIDEVRAKHGVQRVALVAHSYGGILSRWYIDDPKRARKVARVANFGSPWWGAPKAWFAMAYGYETPAGSPIDHVASREQFGTFTKNLTGLYYLIPPQAWFDRAPASIRNWLEVNDQPVRSSREAVDAVRAFGGNGDIAASTAANHADHIDGFSRANGVDWRIFIGSGMPTLGHVRAYTGSDRVQYSWINGDGTVPLISQRQSPTAGSTQMGDKTPTYNFCGIGHMGEMEDAPVQDAAAPFIANGDDPIVDGNALKGFPCLLNASEFSVTGDEDERSIEISKLASAGAASVRPRGARAAQAGRMSLADAEAAGLVEVMYDAGRTVFVTSAPVVVHAAGDGTLQVTPITGEGKRGQSRVYDGPVDVTARGAKTEASVGSRPADVKAPRTTAKVRRSGARRVVTLKASDASGVAVTMVQVGKSRPRPYTRTLKVGRRTTVRYWSIDTVGNAERKRLAR